MKLPPKILLSLILTLSGTVYFIYSSLRDHKRVVDAQEWVNHANEVIKTTDQAYTAVTEIESAARGYAITGDKVFLHDVHAIEEQVRSGILRMKELVADSPEQLERVSKFQAYAEKKIRHYDAVKKVADASLTERAKLVSSIDGKAIMDSLKSVITDLKTAENGDLTERINQNGTASQKSVQANITSGVAFCLFTIVILYLLYRDMKLRRVAEKISAQSELKYRALIENSAVVTYTANMEGKFTFVSHQAAELTGFTSQELIGTHYGALIEPEYFSMVQDTYVNQSREKLHECVVEFPIVTKDGLQRWVEQSCVLQSGPDGPIGYQCIVKNITQQKLAEMELEKAEAARREEQYRLQAILDNTPLMIYVKDLDGRYIVANQQFKETFALKDESILGKTFEELAIAEANIVKYRYADKQVITTGEPVELEDILMTPDGPINLYTTKFPLFDSNDRLFATGGIAKDVTDLARSHQKLVAARKRAEQAEKLQEQFLANMSHEIRTPMNGIVGMTELLSNTELTAQQNEFIQLIRRSSDTLLVLIDDILDLSKIKAGKLDIEKIPFSIEDVVVRVMDSMKMKVEEKSLEFQLSVDEQIKGRFLGDQYRLQQILLNLISNATKFTSKGHVSLDIWVKQRSADSMIISFRVSDTGIGIQPDKLDRIFDTFTQAEADISRRFGGTGLGLAITRNLVELQNGTIEVNSVPGEGTTFEVNMPYEIVKEISTEEIKPVRPKHVCFKGKKVLIVEDNEINQQVMFHHLKNMGIISAIANNGREAVNKFEAGEKFDLVIMDLQMPEMNGFQTSTYIRKKLNNMVPIIAMTASVMKNERRECLDAGMNEYLSKPFVPEELLELLKQFLLRVEPSCPSAKCKNSGAKAYDFDVLMTTGGDSLVSKIIDLFLDQTPYSLQQLKEKAIEENWEAVRQIAHKLKGSSGVLQIKTMVDLLAKIESDAREQEHVDEILPLITKLESEYNVLKPMLEAEQHSFV